jgi:hypothetical protein
MVLERVYPSGEEEWYCPTCGRRFRIHWPPSYSKVILETGDKNAIHSGGRRGAVLDTTQDLDVPGMSFQYADGAETVSIDEQDEWLLPYIEWLEKIGFESLWKEG